MVPTREGKMRRAGQLAKIVFDEFTSQYPSKRLRESDAFEELVTKQKEVDMEQRRKDEVWIEQMKSEKHLVTQSKAEPSSSSKKRRVT